MQIDHRAFLVALGTAAAINAMPSEALADALEHHMIENLDAETTANEQTLSRARQPPHSAVERWNSFCVVGPRHYFQRPKQW